VLEVPLQWHTGFGRYGDADGSHLIFMYYATRHGKPLVGGFAARYPQRDLDEMLRLPVYDQLLGLLPQAPPGTYHPIPAGRPPGAEHPRPCFTAADLRRLGIGYVVTHRDIPRPEAEAYIDGLHLPVLADDGTVIVRKVP
jgi:hypothetical protein